MPTPLWLDRLENRIPAVKALGVPRLNILIVTLQALGFLMVSSEPLWIERLALLPERVLQNGEYWRLITYLSLPLSLSPIWVILTLWFLYSILGSLEAEWGEFRTTFYVLMSIVITTTYSLACGYPVTQVRDFESTLFLAAAAIFPEQQVLLLFLPVKMKWLAWLTLAVTGLSFFQGDWTHRGYLVAIFSNYLAFFGPAQLERLRLWRRRARFKSRMDRF